MNKKQIGIVTLYDNINIGNKLQNYAVQTFFESLGFECKTIVHWEMAHHRFNLRDMKRIVCKIIKLPSKKYLQFKLEDKRKKRFKSFSDHYIKTGENVKMRKIPDDLHKKYDYFVVGSDQVWHNWTNSLNELKYFFLQFTEREQRIAFSPSFGKNEIEEEFKNYYKKYLNEFKYLTCREQRGADMIKELTGKEVPVILDPTMLISINEWKKMEKKPIKVPTKDYILLYFLGPIQENTLQLIDQIKLKNECDVINLTDFNYPDYYLTTPDEFIYYINNAKIVLTDSFHACVFSILFKKNFIAINRKNTSNMGNMESRIDTLLKKFDLTNRKQENMCIDDIFNTNYENIDKIIENERIKTISIFKNILEN